MKTNLTDEQMQAAINEACNKVPIPVAIHTVKGGAFWEHQTPARLYLLKSALEHLPEPPPPVVDSKTQLSTLRPIAEAGDVTAGCVRYFFQVSQGCSFSSGTLEQGEDDTHFADIRLPESKEEKPAPAQPWTPKAGDVVTLKSGGLKMTIIDFHSDGQAICNYFDGSKLCTPYFPLATLQPA